MNIFSGLIFLIFFLKGRDFYAVCALGERRQNLHIGSQLFASGSLQSPASSFSAPRINIPLYHLSGESFVFQVGGAVVCRNPPVWLMTLVLYPSTICILLVAYLPLLPRSCKHFWACCHNFVPGCRLKGYLEISEDKLTGVITQLPNHRGGGGKLLKKEKVLYSLK